MIYFLYGPDNFRSKKKLNEIIEEYRKIHKSGLNLIYIDVKEIDFKSFYSNFKITSMFAEKKLIILKNVFLTKNENAKFQEEFLENLNIIQDLKDIVIIYEGDAVDQRTKFFKELKKKVKCQEFKILQPAVIAKWVFNEFENKGIKINADAVALLLSYTENNLWRLSNEINKLINYLSIGKQIKKEDVELLVKSNIENDIFKTIESLALKNKKEALTLLHRHIENGDNALYLLSMIAYQFRNLLIIKDLMDKKISLSNSGLHPFVIKKTSYLCRSFSLDQLKDIYQKIFEIDTDIKIGKINAELSLDLLVSQI